ncbi:FtsX-like permease family protein [Algoriphagus formosus]|uniref:FtsX-like permease family protein n=1 Tax=Algoriphagus formosus TaxID=2007308 RepID=A0A4R5UW95_9BACT|nr:FtsX-like permease family protein [Algoriphagus aquimaris]TDK43522.1 FtsX-like permease family protein [Algoriphagus aquimaris]
MLNHYLKLALRNFSNKKGIFAINLFGLTTGLVTLLLITSWVRSELGVLKGHEKGEYIYQVLTNHDNSAGINTIPVTPGRMAEAMRDEYSQIDVVTGMSPYIEGVSFESVAEKTTTNGFFVDQEFFEIFTVNMIAGSSSGALEDQNSVVISESLALKMFDSPEEAIGKTLAWKVFSFSNEVEIKGVYRDFTEKEIVDEAHFLLNYDYFLGMLGDGVHWDNYNGQAIALMNPGVDINEFNNSFVNFIKDREEGSNVTPFLQAYEDMYLHTSYEAGKVAGGKINYIYIFSAIALFILLIACINFMNLTTARAMSRVKEIGVKKTMGANRTGLFAQFMTESLLLTGMALIIAVVLMYILMPFFNSVTGKLLNISFGIKEVAILIGIWIFTSMIAGIYPSVYLSKFRPMQVLRSTAKGSFGELLARKGLVIFQFSISLLLIIGITVISRQMSFIQNQNLGYNQTQIIQISANDFETSKANSFLEQLRKLPGVENASSLSHNLVGLSSSTIGLRWEGKDETEQVKFENITVNLDLIETMGFKVMEGRSFSSDYGQEREKLILNEEAVKTIGLENPIGEVLNLWGNDMEVIGVVKNFNFESLKETVKPAFLKYDDEFATKFMVRIQSKNQDQTLAEVADLYQENTGLAMDYSFLDEDFQSLYNSEKRIASLSKYFGGIAILLSCLGLFGLATFTAEKRKKEIGVRKVMGASIPSILRLVTKDFLQLIFLAILLSVPLGWYLSYNWLNDYAYKTNLSWWIFVGSSLLLVLIALLTVGYQAFQAARNNPVNSLKSE